MILYSYKWGDEQRRQWCKSENLSRVRKAYQVVASGLSLYISGPVSFIEKSSSSSSLPHTIVSIEMM